MQKLESFKSIAIQNSLQSISQEIIKVNKRDQKIEKMTQMLTDQAAETVA